MFDWGEERTVCVHRGQLVWYCLVLTVYSPETPGKQKILEEVRHTEKESAQYQIISCPTRTSSELYHNFIISNAFLPYFQ